MYVRMYMYVSMFVYMYVSMYVHICVCTGVHNRKNIRGGSVNRSHIN